MFTPICRSSDRFRTIKIQALLRHALLLAALMLFVAPPAMAQDSQLQGLVDRIDRLQRELVTLQRQVYRGEKPPEPSELPVSNDGSTTALARIELRLSQFESELRSLTGQAEEASFRFNQVSERLDRLATDLEVRLQRLEQATPGLAAAPGTLSQPGSTAGLTPPAADTGAPMQSPATPGVIGTVDPAQVDALRTQQAAAPSAAPATGTAKEQYDHAFGLLSQANYSEAEGALRAFVEQNPTDPLAGNAKYWLGETYYVRGDFQSAAVTFAEAYQEYPDNSKAPDNLLKLGLSLGALGNKTDACGTLSELLKRYKDAAVTLIQRAKQEQQRLGCS
jgi:tol-pal system protein YbgF